jgi:sterol-4alpha-carboxylate 3-dehydrogenase (decarboxylating)
MEAAGGGGGRWCVVTGGRGFAARHLVTMLLRSGEWRVRVADLPPAITLDRDEEEGYLGAALREGQAAYASADLRDKAQVARGAGALPFPSPPPQIVSQSRI